MHRIIASSSFKEGRWLNGMGVSWEIAAEPPGAVGADFGWRFALARIEADVPFSVYPRVDRVFTLIEGAGLDLDVEGFGRVEVHAPFVLHRFPGDCPTSCALRGGPCRSLNLFFDRDAWRAEVEVGQTAAAGHAGTRLLFVLRGSYLLDGERLACGDAALVDGSVDARATGEDALLYTARLIPVA